MARPKSTFILICSLIALLASATDLHAQSSGALTGRITEIGTGAPVPAASVFIEGTGLGVLSDSAGRYRLAGVPPGPQVMVVQRIGYATARQTVTVRGGSVVARDVELASSVLQLPTLTVTGDPIGGTRVELGTASVIDRAAIEVQTATSLAGVLELIPGAQLQPPGLAGAQQFSPPERSDEGRQAVWWAAPLASFGTLIVMDGVPLSNNANLQRRHRLRPQSRRGRLLLGRWGSGRAW